MTADAGERKERREREEETKGTRYIQNVNCIEQNNVKGLKI